MLYLPEYLFYEPKQFKEQLTAQYTGSLDVPTALQNNPRCWKKQDIAGTKHKKTIVISGFRLGVLMDVAGLENLQKKVEQQKVIART
jgi:hypothetical protein